MKLRTAKPFKMLTIIGLFSITSSSSISAQSDTSNKIKSIADSSNAPAIMTRAKEPENWQQYVSESLKFPKEFRREKVVVKIYVDFIVETDGSVDSIKIFSSQGYINKTRATSAQLKPFADEIIRVISGSPAWGPATRNGMPIRSYFTRTPFTFNTD